MLCIQKYNDKALVKYTCQVVMVYLIKDKLGLVSVIMPAYNAEKTILNSISSVLSQSYEHWELIVIDDCSTDKTLDIVNGVSDGRVKVVVNRVNSGVAKSRNTGISIAKGQYIAFLDSDDLWYTNKLEKQVEAIKKSKLACSHGQYDFIDDDGCYLGKKVKVKGIVEISDMRRYNQIGNLTGMYDCWQLGKIYQEKTGHEDYYMWCKVLTKTKSIGINETIASYRITQNSLSSNKFRCILWHYKALKASHKLNIFSRAYYMMHYIMNGLKNNF